MKMTNGMLQTLADAQDAIQSAFGDYGLDANIEIDDANGFMEMIVDVEFYGGVSAQFSINLETSKLITGDDSEESVDDAAIWRRIAFLLAKQLEEAGWEPATPESEGDHNGKTDHTR